MKRNQIIITTGNNYTEITKKLLEGAGLADHIQSKCRDMEKNNIRIGIKPNLVSPSPAEDGATTHPEVVAGIIEYLKKYGYDNISIMEGSWVGDRTKDAYEICGYEKLCHMYNVPFLDGQTQEYIETDCDGLSIKICKCALDTDFMINVPVLKGHGQTKITCALKNMKGMISNAEKRHFHSLGLHEPIAKLGLGIRQDFIVVDNICGDLDYEDGGNPVIMNRVWCGLDPVLIDAQVCRMMGYQLSEVPYIGIANSLGVGSNEIPDMLFYDTEKNEIRPYRENASQLYYRRDKSVNVKHIINEVNCCSACYASLTPALWQLKEEGIFDKLPGMISIGQGNRGCSGKYGIGNCTSNFEKYLKGCPPKQEEVYKFLKSLIDEN